jgi:DNA (cytosine-5)-methyltransferase 1
VNFKPIKARKGMKHIGLFEGIGGFSLAARWMNWETVAWCEWDEFCQKVLKYHFPEAEQHGDITTTDFTRYAGQIDILTGGFPCQPYSSAGKRLGKEDDRHLWPEMLRAIREIQPRWVVGENVRGLTNWNGGLVFDEVQADLENEGYEVTPYLLPACAVNAPHRRDRIWFVAHRQEERLRKGAGIEGRKKSSGERANLWCGASSTCAQWPIAHANGNGYELRRLGQDRCEESKSTCEQEKRERIWGDVGRAWESGATANADKDGLQRGAEFGSVGGGRENSDKQPAGCVCPNWDQFPTQSPVCSRNDGIPDGLVGITFSKHREKSIGAYGNAIVPQVALQIFKAIQQYEQNLHNHPRSGYTIKAT